jgi:glycosyltransferase involved in cell wall biosynthesis
MLFWVAWVLNRMRGFPYTLLIHDVYPDVAIRLGILSEKGIAARLWRLLNRCAYKRARAIIVLSERMREALAEHPGVDREKLVVIHNWVDPAWIHPLDKGENPFVHEQGLSEKLVVLYSGNMGRHHDLETLIEAADRCRERPDVLFLFIGDGAKKGALVARARERGLDNVRFLPYQPLDRLPYTIPAADIGVVTLERGVEGLCVPSKLYTYLAAGVAILGLVARGSEVDDTIGEFDCGFRVDQMDVTSVVEALERWASQPALLKRHKRNARRALEERYTRSQALQRYIEVLSLTH